MMTRIAITKQGNSKGAGCGVYDLCERLGKPYDACYF